MRASRQSAKSKRVIEGPILKKQDKLSTSTEHFHRVTINGKLFISNQFLKNDYTDNARVCWQPLISADSLVHKRRHVQSLQNKMSSGLTLQTQYLVEAS